MLDGDRMLVRTTDGTVHEISLGGLIERDRERAKKTLLAQLPGLQDETLSKHVRRRDHWASLGWAVGSLVWGGIVLAAHELLL